MLTNHGAKRDGLRAVIQRFYEVTPLLKCHSWPAKGWPVARLLKDGRRRWHAISTRKSKTTVRAEEMESQRKLTAVAAESGREQPARF